MGLRKLEKQVLWTWEWTHSEEPVHRNLLSTLMDFMNIVFQNTEGSVKLSELQQAASEAHEKFSYLVHEAMLRLIQSYEWDVVSSVSVLSFIYLSFCLPIHFVYLYTCVCLSVPLFVCQKAGLAVSPSIHLSGVRFAGTLLLWQIAHP